MDNRASFYKYHPVKHNVFIFNDKLDCPTQNWFAILVVVPAYAGLPGILAVKRG